MSVTINQPDECLDESRFCQGPIVLTESLSGETRAYRCERHADDYRDRMDALDRDVRERFPGWDVPGSVPPAWFDPSYAGESWDEPE